MKNTSEQLLSFAENELIDKEAIRRFGGVLEALARAKKCACPPNCRRLGKKTPCAEHSLCADCDSPDRICKVTAVFDRCPSRTSTLVIVVDEDLGY